MKRNINPGPNTRMIWTPFGYCVGGQASANDFTHPWQPYMSNKTVTFNLGLVNGYTPVIKTASGNMPMDGGDSGIIPNLTLDPQSVNSTTQQSWACVEVTPKADGTLDQKSLIQIVHRNAPTLASATIGRQPLAMIQWKNNSPFICYPQCWFNLKYYRTTPPVGGGLPLHLFL